MLGAVSALRRLVAAGHCDCISTGRAVPHGRISLRRYAAIAQNEGTPYTGVVKASNSDVGGGEDDTAAGASTDVTDGLVSTSAEDLARIFDREERERKAVPPYPVDPEGALQWLQRYGRVHLTSVTKGNAFLAASQHEYASSASASRSVGPVHPGSSRRMLTDMLADRTLAMLVASGAMLDPWVHRDVNATDPGCVDLHGMAVPLARAAVRWTMNEVLHAIKFNDHISFVTGRGKHSIRGKSVLRPVVMRQLEDEYVPSLEPLWSRHDPGTVVVERRTLDRWLVENL